MTGVIMLALTGIIPAMQAAAQSAASPAASPAGATTASPTGATAGGATPGAPALTYPRRKTGLWEIRSVGAQASGLPAMQFCVGELTDTAATHLDRTPGTRGACTLGPFLKATDTWVSESVCRETRTVVTSRAVAAGNFETEYRIDTLVTYDPPLGGVRRQDKDAVVARWLGTCAKTQRPGDMIIPGMGILNMTDGGFRPEPEPKPPKGRAKAAASREAPAR